MIGLSEMIDRQNIEHKSFDNESHSQYRISVNKSGIFDNNMKASAVNSDHEQDQISSHESQRDFKLENKYSDKIIKVIKR